jgi:hypothetical protein
MSTNVSSTIRPKESCASVQQQLNLLDGMGGEAAQEGEQNAA